MTDVQDQTGRDLKNIGERLALLLASSDMPDDVKEAWAAMIPEMTLEQIDKLASLLASSLGSAAESEVASFVEAVSKAKEEQVVRVKQVEDQAHKELDEIEALLHGEN